MKLLLPDGSSSSPPGPLPAFQAPGRHGGFEAQHLPLPAPSAPAPFELLLVQQEGIQQLLSPLGKVNVI